MPENENVIRNVDELVALYKQEKAKIPISIGGRELNIIISPTVSLETQANIVIEIANTVFPIYENGDRVYAPFYFGIALKTSILRYFTNIETGEDISVEALHTLCNSRLYYEILEKIDTAQYDAIIEAAYDLIEYKKNMAYTGERKKIEDMAKTLEAQVADINTILEIISKSLPALTPDMVSSYMDVAAKISALTPDEIAAIANGLVTANPTNEVRKPVLREVKSEGK